MLIVSNLQKELYQHIANRRVRVYWIDKGKSFISNPSTDLSSFYHATRNINLKLRVWLTKQIAGICGMGKQLERQGDQHHSRCPHCNNLEDNINHVLTYSHSSTALSWRLYIEELTDWLVEHHASDIIVEFTISILHSVRLSKPIETIVDNKLTQA